jgi:hypothetical protein
VLLVAFALVATMVPGTGSARSAGVEANTLKAVCTAALTVQPINESPGNGGSFSATLRAPCTGLGVAYNFIQISVTRYDLVTSAYKGLKYVNCYRVSACSMGYAFSGGPDHFKVSAFVWWDSTSGPWLFATPGLVVSSSPMCYGVGTGEWPVTPVGAASKTVGCNLLFDAVL